MKGNTQLELPAFGILNDGTTVSNYHLLPMEKLTAEGWRPRKDIKPEYNPDTHHLEQGAPYEENGTVIVPYTAIENLPDDIDVMFDELEALV